MIPKKIEHYVIECTGKGGNKNNQENSKERKGRKTSQESLQFINCRCKNHLLGP